MTRMNSDRAHLVSEVALSAVLLLLCDRSVNVDQPHFSDAATYLLLLVAANLAEHSLDATHLCQCPPLAKCQYKVASGA